MLLRRRMMGGVKDEYIQDGLVFWLDGINKGEDNTAWTDLIGGIKFAYNANCQVNNDNVYFGGTGSISSDKSLIASADSSTIEIVLNATSVSNALWFQASGSKAIMCKYTSTAICFASSTFNTNNQYIRNNRPSGKNCISINTERIVINATQEELAKGNSTNGTTTLASIGSFGNTYKAKGSIYSIRIYNRMLSTSEMQYNQKIDNARFNLGLNI